jgi:putative redox protein
MINKVATTWKGGMLFESTNPGGNLLINDGENLDVQAYGPKALMLSSLAGCSGLDVASLMKKMRVEVDNFDIDVEGELTDEHPKYYHKVQVTYNFYGANLEKDKLQKIVDLSVDKYCGVMEMFKRFAEVKVEIKYHT